MPVADYGTTGSAMPVGYSYIISSPTVSDPNAPLTSDQSLVTWNIENKSGISPILYFKYIKSKFGLLEKRKIDSRLKIIEKAFEEAVENGQDVLATKFLDNLHFAIQESAMLAKGITTYIDREVLNKHKHNIRGGHISNTLWKDYTRVIPPRVVYAKKKVEDIFNTFEIWHYWDVEASKKVEKKEKMTADEKSKMKDPVVFGMLKGSTRMYFIAEWTDEYCDLSFDEIVKVLGKSGEGKVKHTISKQPNLAIK